MASPFGTIPALGARLAKLHLRPRPRADRRRRRAGGRGAAARPPGPPSWCVESAMPYRTRLRRGVVGPAQHDHDGEPDRPRPATRTSRAIGPHGRPKAQLVGVRGAPGNTVNHPTSYWVPDHSTRTLRRAGRRGQRRRLRPGRRGRRRRRPASTRSAASSPTSACSTSRRPTAPCACARVHPGVTVDEIVAATGFALHRSATTSPRPGCPRPRSSTSSATCSTRARCATARCGAEPDVAPTRGAGRHGSPWHPALTPSCASGRRPLPHRADRHGLGGRPPAGGRHRRGGRPRHPGLGHHDAGRAGAGHRRGALAGPTGPSASTCAPTWPTWHERVALMIDNGRPGGQLRPGAQPGPGRPLQGGRAVRHADGRRPAPRREGGRLGRRRGHRPGRRRRRPHRHRPHLAPAAPGGRRRGRPGPGPRRRRLLRRARPGGRPGLRRGRRRHGDALPALGREPGARRRQGALPGDTGDRHGRDHQGRRRPPAGGAHRPGRPPGGRSRGSAPCRAPCAAPTSSARRRARPSRRCCGRAAP